jgi:hypothetical protein
LNVKGEGSVVRGAYKITGRITRRDTNEGVHGLQVEAWNDDRRCDDCLGSDLTNRDGSFRIALREEDFSESKGCPEVYLKIRDRDLRLIFDTGSDKCRCEPGEVTEFNLSLVPDILWWHLSRPVSWEKPVEPLVPADIIDEIEEAVELLVPVGAPGHVARLTAVLGAVPFIEVFGRVLQDAWSTLRGDLQAAARYRDVLEALCSVVACTCCETAGYVEELDHIFDKEWRDESGKDSPCVPPECCPENHAPGCKCAKKHGKKHRADCTCGKKDGKKHRADCTCGKKHGKKHCADCTCGKKDDRCCGCGKDHSTAPCCPCKDSVIPDDKVIILVMAALQLSCGHAGTAKAYTKAILDQICRFELLGALHRSASKALCGDKRARKHFGDLVEFIGTTCGTDDKKRPTFPARCPLCCCGACLDEKVERCIRDAVGAWSEIHCYTVSELRPPRACPGDELVICGDCFGDSAGRVLFRQKGAFGPGPKVSPETWCDNKITVIVPEAAGCGLTLRLPADTVRVCDRFLEYRPLGCMEADFEGTSPEILKFTVKGHFQGECLRPGEPLRIRWNTCAIDRVRVAIIDEWTGAVIAERDPAEAHGRWDFTATNFTTTTRLRVQITAEGRCEPYVVEEYLSLVFQAQPDLTVDGIEITQAIQYYHAAQHLTDPADRGPDNSLRLVTNKTAWIRTYLRSGQDPAFDGGQLLGVDGMLTVERRVGGVWGVVANIGSQNGPITAQDSFATYDAERGNINNSLNFVVPPSVVTGLLRFTVNVSSDLPQCPGNQTTAQLVADVNLTQTLNAAFITIAYNGVDAAGTGMLNLPAPTLAQCQAETAWAMTTYPVSGNANVRIAGTFITTTPLNDPRSCPGCCSPNWQPLLQQVANLVALDQAANPGGNWVYYGLVAGGIPVNVPGCNGWGATGGLAGQPITYAHEIGHQFGLPHARCGNAGTGNANYPVYEPYDLPVDPPGTTNWTMASTGEYGLDINNGNIANPNAAKDFMSYCFPRWISAFTYNFLTNAPGLVPQVIPTGGGGGGSERIIRDTEPGFQRRGDRIEPLVHMLGRIDDDGNVEVSSVARLETRYLVGNGVPTDYVAELVADDGRIIAQDQLYRYDTEGGGCGKDEDCHGCGNHKRDRTFLFKAMLEDRETGERLRIVRRGEVVWERVRPSRPPTLTRARAELDEAGNLRLRWTLRTYGEVPEDVWIQLSNDDGQTWRALTVGIRGNTAEIVRDQLPSGRLRFQVLANDGFQTVSATTGSVDLPARSATVTIFYPKEGDQVYAERLLHLWGTATSDRGEDLTEEQFTWFIDDAEVGRGRDIWVDNPGAGRHEVRLEVSDQAGTGAATSAIELQSVSPSE